MLNLSILLFCVAIALLGLAGFIFRVRVAEQTSVEWSCIAIVGYWCDSFHRLFGHDLPFLS